MSVNYYEMGIAADKVELIQEVLLALDEATTLIAAFTQTEENQDLLTKLFDNIEDVKTIVSSVDLMETTTDDIEKGSYLGNRKLDIDLALNKSGITSTTLSADALAIWQDVTNTVYYDRATCTFTDGTVINVDFVNDGLQPITVSTHGSIIDQLNANTAFTTKLENTSITEDVGGIVGTVLRIVDITGLASNIVRIELRAVTGSYTEAVPIYFWAKTTSSLQTLSSRIGELLAIAPNLTQLATLSSSITEMLAVQAKLTELTAIYTNLTELLNTSTYSQTATTKADEASASATLAIDQVTLASDQVTLATNQVVIATTKADEANASAALASSKATEATDRANEIKSVTSQATTLVAGSPATVAYNSTDGKFTFGIPQGLKGDRGDAFSVDASGTIVGRVAYDGASTGFSYLSLDEAPTQIYFKKSDTSGDWSVGVAFGKGDTGATGLTGNGISSVARTSGTGASGTTDTYTITFTDATTATLEVTHGANGEVLQADLDNAVATINASIALKADQATTYTKTEVNTLFDNIVADTPVVTGSATVVELSQLVLTITDHQAGDIYETTLVTATLSSLVDDTITLDASSVTADTAGSCTVKRIRDGYLISAPYVFNFTVTNITSQDDTDTSILVGTAEWTAGNYPTVTGGSLDGGLVATTTSSQAISSVVDKTLIDADGDWSGTQASGFVTSDLPNRIVSTDATNITVQDVVTNGDVLYIGDGTNENEITASGVVNSDENTHDIFCDSSIVVTYNLDSDATDLGGTYNGTATDVTYDVGKFGNAGIFNGSSSEIAYTSFPTSNLNDGSISLWFNVAPGSSSALRALFGNEGSSNTDRCSLYFRLSDGLFQYSNNTSEVDIIDGFTYDDNTWHHILITPTSIYIDGVLKNTYTKQVTCPTTDVFYLGRRYTASVFNLLGSIDQVRVFNRALTQEEVTALYNESVSKLAHGQIYTPTYVCSQDNVSLELSADNGTTYDVLPKLSSTYISGPVPIKIKETFDTKTLTTAGKLLIHKVNQKEVDTKTTDISVGLRELI